MVWGAPDGGRERHPGERLLALPQVFTQHPTHMQRARRIDGFAVARAPTKEIWFALVQVLETHGGAGIR